MPTPISLIPRLAGPLDDAADIEIDDVGAQGSKKIAVSVLVQKVLDGVTSGSKTIYGGKATADRLLLKATSDPAPSGNGVGIFGGLTEGLRVKAIPVGTAGEGKPLIVMGDDPGYSGAANSLVVVRRGTPTTLGSQAQGTAFSVIGGDDDKPAGANGNGVLIQWRLRNGGTGVENEAMNVITVSEDPAYGGSPACLNPRLLHFTDVTNTNGPGGTTRLPTLFSMNPQVIIGKFKTGAAYASPRHQIPDPAFGTQHPVINCIEVTPGDRSADVGLNTGFCHRAAYTGISDIGAAYLVASQAVVPGTFRNGYTVSTNAKAIAADPWATATPYELGEVIHVGGVRYICLIGHTSNTSTHNTPPGNSTDWQACNTTVGPTDNHHWCGPMVGATAAGSTPDFQVTVGGKVVLKQSIQFGSNISGVQILYGSAVPSASAADGSLYLRTGGGGSFYQRVSGAWVLQ